MQGQFGAVGLRPCGVQEAQPSKRRHSSDDEDDASKPAQKALREHDGAAMRASSKAEPIALVTSKRVRQLWPWPVSGHHVAVAC